MSLLCGNYRPLRGSITVSGIPLQDLNPTQFRKQLGIVQQDTELFNASIEWNVCFGVDNYTREELDDATKKANCTFIADFEEGFNTMVGERGVKISGGQKQRIAIARVLMKKPNFLLLDEATSNLDSESEAMVQQSIDDLVNSDGRPTVVLVAHRLSTVINADMIAVVDDGKIAELGNHQELLRQDGIYAQLVRRQVTTIGNTLDADASTGTVDALFASI